MERHVVTFRLDAGEHVLAARRSRAKAARWSLGVGAGLLLAIWLGFFAMDPRWTTAALLPVFGIALAGGVWNRNRQLRGEVATAVRERPWALRDQTLELGPDGIVHRDEKSRAELAWDAVQQVRRRGAHVELWLHPGTVVLVPAATVGDVERFVADAERWRAAAKGRAFPVPEQPPPGRDVYRLVYDAVPADVVALSRFVNRRETDARRGSNLLGLAAAGLLAIASLVALAFGRDGFTTAHFGLVGFVLLFTGVLLTTRWWSRWLIDLLVRRQVRKNPYVVGPRTLFVGPTGLAQFGGPNVVDLDWASIREVARDEAHTYLFLQARSAFVVPHRAMADPARFSDDVERWCAEAPRLELPARDGLAAPRAPADAFAPPDEP